MKSVRIVLGLLLGLSVAAPVVSAEKAHTAINYTIGDGVGVGGYDPVSYFQEGGPQKGHILRSHAYKGVSYRFSSTANLETFKADPEKYLPAYGGYCAWAVAKLNKKVDIDPESYQVREGKLYLFYKDPELDTLADWKTKEKEYFPLAEANWRKMRQ